MMSQYLVFVPYRSQLLNKAYIFAHVAHQDQTRKYTGEPYVNHVIEVATILAGLGCTDETMLAAALLHDTVEDCDVTIEQIGEEFGERVQMLVHGLTDDKIEGNRKARKAHDLQRLAATCVDVKTIKCCDLVSNTRDIALHDKNFAKVYLQEKRDLLDNALREASPVAYARAVLQWNEANELIRPVHPTD